MDISFLQQLNEPHLQNGIRIIEKLVNKDKMEVEEEVKDKTISKSKSSEDAKQKIMAWMNKQKTKILAKIES